MGLRDYRLKRDFGRTPEPRGDRRTRRGRPLFVVHEHRARNLHYDLRLEHRGVLLSWAVPKGPPLVAGERRLAVRTEDHPLAYASFEGRIPEGEYGAGTVEIWDRGSWQALEPATAAIRRGRLPIALDGQRLNGRWLLVRLSKGRSRDGREWLLIKRSDAARRSKGKKTTARSRRMAPGRTPGAVRDGRGRAPPSGQVAGVRLSHPERVLIPDPGLTKADLALYYQAVAGRLLPHIVDRPLTVLRCPAGQGSSCFYQKHPAGDLPVSIDAIDVPGSRPAAPYLGIHDLTGLIELVQRAAIELHPWGARRDLIERPDRLVIDLDPGPGVAWKRVVRAAHELRALAHELGLVSFVRTTGGKGLHVVLPVARRSTWNDAKSFARSLAEALARSDSGAFVLNASKRQRRGRIFVDYLRNARGATAIAPYSARARAGAPVATPLAWDELTAATDPKRFHVRSVLDRLESTPDPWAGFFEVRQTLTRSILSRVEDL